MNLTANPAIPLDILIHVFSDSSWQYCPDTGRSMGSYMIFLYGSLVRFSSFVPDLVALFSAEAKYNTCCHACMALAHVHGIFLGIERLDPNSTLTTSIILDSKSVQAMGNSFCDTAHMHHIMRRYHYVRHQHEVGEAVLH